LKRFCIVLALLALAPTAHASGIALRWGSCEGTSNRNFACDRGTGQELLVGTFEPPGGISKLTGIEVILSIAAADGTVPSWWQMFDTGSCRRGSIQAAFDVSDQAGCDDPWSGGAAGGGVGQATALRVSQYNIGDPAGVDLWLAAAVAPDVAQSVSSGRKYAAFKLIINHQKSSGAGACAGCSTPMCITLNAIRLTQPGRDPSVAQQAKYVDLTQGISGMGGASQVATWQGGTPNCSAGLAKPSTWSELKARFKSK
jgi:hypothetical protein